MSAAPAAFCGQAEALKDGALALPAAGAVLRDAKAGRSAATPAAATADSAKGDDLEALVGQSGATLSPDATAMEKLAAVFNAGTAPSEEDLRGFHAGRGFWSHEPNTPHAALVVGLRLPPVPDGGPIFGKVFKLFSLSCYGAPDACDRIDAKQSKQIAELIKENVGGFPVATFGPSEASTSAAEKGNSVRYQFRKAGRYIIEKVEQRGNHNVDGYAYYFKKVRPEKPTTFLDKFRESWF